MKNGVNAFLAVAFLLLLPLVLAVGLGMSFFGRLSRLNELSCHFMAVYFFLSLFIFVLLGWLKAAKKLPQFFSRLYLLPLLTSFAVVVVAGCRLAPLFLPDSAGVLNANRSAREVSILHLNLWGGRNRDKESLFKIIEREKPELLAFCEIEGSWGKLLKERLAAQYPHSALFSLNGGVALFSKYPFESSTLRFHGPRCRPRWLVKLRLPDFSKSVSIVVAHPPTPVGPPERLTWRNEEFAIYARELKEMGGAGMLIGDLNCSPWSPYFQELTESAALTGGVSGLGLTPTWPNIWIFPRAILPIDHVLTTDDFYVKERKTLEPAGSDHLPLYVRAVLRKVTPSPGASDRRI